MQVAVTALRFLQIYVNNCLLHRAMSSASGKEQFMKQFDAIVDGVKQNKVKVSTAVIESSSLRVTGTGTGSGAGWLTCVHMVRCRLVDVRTHGQVQAG
jgi:hypothetical protein